MGRQEYKIGHTHINGTRHNGVEVEFACSSLCKMLTVSRIVFKVIKDEMDKAIWKFKGSFCRLVSLACRQISVIVTTMDIDKELDLKKCYG